MATLTIHTGKASEQTIRALGRVVATAEWRSEYATFSFRMIVICVSGGLPYRVFVSQGSEDSFSLVAATETVAMAYQAVGSKGAFTSWSNED